ncbi:MAG: hypothetical protein ACRC5Q_00255 [Culicoidibacterales bacterium]
MVLQQSNYSSIEATEKRMNIDSWPNMIQLRKQLTTQNKLLMKHIDQLTEKIAVMNQHKKVE